MAHIRMIWGFPKVPGSFWGLFGIRIILGSILGLLCMETLTQTPVGYSVIFLSVTIRRSTGITVPMLYSTYRCPS